MLLFVVSEFFRRRRKPRRATDEIPADPLLRVLVFWVLFGLGALAGGLAMVAAISGAWIVSAASALGAAAGLAGSIVIWRNLNR